MPILIDVLILRKDVKRMLLWCSDVNKEVMFYYLVYLLKKNTQNETVRDSLECHIETFFTQSK